MPNIKQIISNHNKSTMKRINPQEPPQTTCNCRKGKACPLDGKCLTSGIIYQATVTRQDNQKEESYIGLTGNTFKTRYNGHTDSFRNENKRNSTTLSQYIWTLKDSNTPFTLKWKIMARSNPYSTSSKTCNLCLKEKYFIICKPEMGSLITRNELAAVCPHRRKYLLCSLIP
jgi:hypothetical protein